MTGGTGDVTSCYQGIQRCPCTVSEEASHDTDVDGVFQRFKILVEETVGSGDVEVRAKSVHMGQY